MQEKLVIYMPANNEPLSWAVVDADYRVCQQAMLDPDDELASIAKDKEVIVIVPAEDVLLTTVRLPAMNRSKLLQAIPYALEEQLIEEVDKLHFAIGHFQPENDLAVAIVSHEKMCHWQSRIHLLGVNAEIVIPLMFALPVTENAWSVLIQEIVVIRQASLQGIACDKPNFPALFNWAVENAPVKPTQLIVYNYSSQSAKEKMLANLSCDEIMRPAEQWMTDLALNACNTPFINLLQGPYAVKKSKLPAPDYLNKTGWLLAKLMLLLLFLYPLGSLLILNNRVKSIDAQISALYKQQFPQAASVVAPKLRMQEKLNKLKSQVGENRPLLLLGYIGKAITETASIQLKRLDYQSNQITLVLSAASSSDFSTFTHFLSSKGLTVKQQNATLAGERVNATIQVE